MATETVVSSLQHPLDGLVAGTDWVTNVYFGFKRL